MTTPPSKATAWTSAAGIAAMASPIILAVVFYLFVLGFRGLGERGLATLEAARLGAEALRGSESLAGLLESPHPAPELLASLIIYLTPEGAAVPTLGWLSLAGILIAGAGVWKFARRLGTVTSAWTATILFGTIPVIIAAATSVSTAAIVLPAWTWLLYFSCRRRQTWWTILIQALLAAILLLSWAPVLLWMALLIVLALVYNPSPASGSAPHPASMYAPASLPVHVLLVPALAFVLATGIHPGFWTDLIGGWTATLGAVLESPAEEVLFRGNVYPPHRLPILSGIIYLWIQLPAVTIIAMLIGAFVIPFGHWMRGRRQESSAEENNDRSNDEHAPGSARLEQPHSSEHRALLWTLALLALLPWMLRSPSYGRVEMIAMAAPIISVFAGLGLCHALRILLEAGRVRDLSPFANAIGVGVATLVILGAPVVESVNMHPHHSAYYNAFVGRLPGAIDRGYPMHGTRGLPLSTVHSAFAMGCTDDPGPCRFYIGEWAPYLEEYVRMGAVDGARLTTNIDEAAMALRRAPDFTPRRQDTAQRAMTTTRQGFRPLPLTEGGIPLFILEVRRESDDPS